MCKEGINGLFWWCWIEWNWMFFIVMGFVGIIIWEIDWCCYKDVFCFDMFFFLFLEVGFWIWELVLGLNFDWMVEMVVLFFGDCFWMVGCEVFLWWILFIWNYMIMDYVLYFWYGFYKLVMFVIERWWDFGVLGWSKFILVVWVMLWGGV